MSTDSKHSIVALIDVEINRLGSQEKTAKKCGVSAATLSQMRAGNWTNIAPEMWAKVGAALGYRTGEWVMADTTNVRLVYQVLDNAKSGSLFMAVSDKAGSGKTAGLRTYEAANRRNSVFYLSCREWAKREFLQNLAQSLGIEAWGKAQSIDKMLMDVVEFFKQRQAARPLLILDEADKLRGPALRSLITLYNECEDGLAVVISGTDHLEKQMRADARYNRKGAEELLSRFGRRFINLAGASETDVQSICTANGLTDKDTIRSIFRECDPVRRMVLGRSVEVVEDLRRVKRAVQRELLKQTASASAEAA